MALRFIAIDPTTSDDGSPTIWLDEGTGDLIIQSWTADESTVQEVQHVGSIPGHSTDIPAHESVIRLPARMLPFIPRPNEDAS
jgi:hypothetical protein